MTILTNSFLTVLNMSYTACFVVVAVLLARLLLGRLKVPRIFCYALWALVLFRLLCPVSIESALSLLPSAEIIAPQVIEEATPSISSGFAIIDEPINAYWQDSYYEGVSQPIGKMKQWAGIAGAIWLAGITLLLGHSLLALRRLRRNLQAAEPLPKARGNAWQVNGLPTAFVLGIFRPQIYLPTGLNDEERSYILLHEQTHLRRGDHLLKLLGFAALLLHWFNPFVWLAFGLAVQDMEMSCDEAVLGKLQPANRPDYSATLLRLAAGGRVGLSPLAFSEGNVKNRIKNALNYRKPTLWLSIAGLLAVLILVILLACNPNDADKSKQLLTVENIAEHFVEQQLNEWPNLNVVDSEITRLEQLAQFDNFLLEAPVQVWALEYRFKPADMNNVPLIEFVQEDGWITQSDILNNHLLVILQESDQPQLLGEINRLYRTDTTAAMESAVRQTLEQYGVIPPETYTGNHAVVQFPLSDGEVCQLLLSQPVKQGAHGIWCVERWLQGNGNLYYAYPPADTSAQEYYDNLQEQCDNGHQPWRLDPLEVAVQYIKDDLGQVMLNREQLIIIQPATLADFAELPESRYFGYILDFEADENGNGHFHLTFAALPTNTDIERLGYINNPDIFPYYFEVTPDTQYIYAASSDYPEGKTAMNAAEFAAYLADYPAESNTPFYVTTKGGFVTLVQE